MPTEPTSEHERLAVLVGRWRTTGATRPQADTPAVKIEAVDTYEWLPGGRGLLHAVDAWMGEEHVEGAEIIGWDSDRGNFVTMYFGTDGPGRYEASLGDEDGTLVWRMSSQSERFNGQFSPDRNTIIGHWERTGPDANWIPWMDVTLAKRSTA